MPLYHPRFRREYELAPAKDRLGAQTRSDLLLCGRGKVVLRVVCVYLYVCMHRYIDDTFHN